MLKNSEYVAPCLPPPQCGASDFDFFTACSVAFVEQCTKSARTKLTNHPKSKEQGLQIAKSVRKKFWSCIREIFLQFLPILAPPTVRTVLAVRLEFHILTEHLDLIRKAKYLQDISIIDEDMESQT